MFELKRTTSGDTDFQNLNALLEQYLRKIDGDEHEFYARLNKIDKIPNVVVLYSDRIPIGCGEKIMYAVLETGSKQYRVAAGDKLEIERLEVEAGKPVTFDRILLVNNEGKLLVGAPTVTGATVTADVVEHKRGEKKLTFKMKRRKGYHKTIGHRQELTVVKITAING